MLTVWSVLSGCGVTYSPSAGEPITADAGSDDRVAVIPPDDAGAVTVDASVFTADVVAPDVVDAPVTVPLGEPPYPIVLVHGFAGFRAVGPLDYFYHVGSDLRARGEDVTVPELTPFAAPPQRAAQLATVVDGVLRRTGRGRVILVAHSQGGLDSRYLISTMHYGDRVAALVTVATPHRGTAVADAFNGLLPGATDALLNVVANGIGAIYNGAPSGGDLRRALSAMTTPAMVTFNAQNPDDPRVRYWSYAGRSNGRDGVRQCADGVVADDPVQRDGPTLFLTGTAALIEQRDPVMHVNDGMVEVASARWGRFMGCVPADHFDEVGQIAHVGAVADSGFDHILFYRDVVRRLRAEGL